ncbi:ubiquilin 1 [Echinococcus multilocularis]|uniref:Ubiquilin 1 n=1 Tax=Echinococcus multilocularis TaxID=6211 RepID=A0A087W2T2_ECHMU|nr:ubiquilin 1 [Echinococcus multilocularis]
MAEIKLKLKAPTQEKTVSVKDNGTIKELREEAAKAFEVTPSRVCLIYAGKILKDENTLSEHKLQDGLTVHVVIKRPSDQGGSATTISTPSSTSAFHTPGQNRPSGAYDPLTASAARFFSSGDTSPSSFASMQQTMQQQVMRNPELLRNVMESPLVQSLVSNPEVMRSIMQSNPQMRELMERNPELSQMLTNPEVLRQSMEIASNPSLVQEMMRSYDRAVLNLESIPGGSGHLQRIYESVQEPMLNAMQGGDANNPFADLAGSTNRQAAPSNEPMPNPWAPPQQQTETTTPATAATTGGGGTQTTTSTSSGGGATTTSLLGGIPFNPETMSSAFQAPYVRQMLDVMASNPETFEAFLSANPVWSSASHDPAMRENLRRMLPQLARQMSRPGFVEMLSNPRAMRAMAQIQEGLRILQEEAPDVFSSMTNISGGAFSAATTDPATTTTASSTESTASEGTEGTATTTPPPTNTSSLGNVELASLMASLLNVAPSGQDPGNVQQLPPEVRYASQLQTLASMGFTNQSANLQALIFSHGDVNAAIDRLLGQGN